MDNYSRVIINGRDYTEKYFNGVYTLFKNKRVLAMVTTSNKTGLYVTGNIKDVNKWFLSLGVTNIM